MAYYGKYRIFNEKEASKYLTEKLESLKNEIASAGEDYVLNVNEEDYSNYLANKYSVEELIIDFDSKYVSNHEADIPANKFPPGFGVRNGMKYKKAIIEYHLPYSGESELLMLKPDTSLLWSMDVIVAPHEITFEFIRFYDDPDRIKNEANNCINRINSSYGYLKSQIHEFNDSLYETALKLVQEKKSQIINNKEFLASLDVPIKKAESVPKTFVVPQSTKINKISIAKPVLHDEVFIPEPALDMDTYQEIMQIIHDVGKQFERLPRTYHNKKEEELRDHFLLFLEPNIRGSATGETFNKEGKTDILIRHEGSNIFIAECKFWKGKKSYLKGISQLIKYLTWRDSKAAIMIFVKSKDITTALNSVREYTSEHPNFLGFVNEVDESWFNYRFHINDDRNREIKLAIMLFHFPEL